MILAMHLRVILNNGGAKILCRNVKILLLWLMLTTDGLIFFYQKKKKKEEKTDGLILLEATDIIIQLNLICCAYYGINVGMYCSANY